MKKYAKKLLALAMVLAMVLSLGVSAYALTDPGYYVQNPVTSNPSQALTITGTATVYLSIVSDRIYDSNDDYVQIERYNMPVSIGTSGVTSVYNVSDVLVAAANQYSGLSFTVANGGTFTSSSTYLYGVKDTAVSNQVFQPATYEDFFDAMDYYDDPYDGMYAYLQYVQNGWKFRINGQIPLLDDYDVPGTYTGDYYGAEINRAYVQNGDVIFLYYADLYLGDNYNEDLGECDYESVEPTEVIKFDDISYDSTGETLTAKLYSSSVFTDIDYNTFDMDWDFSDIAYTLFSKQVDFCIDGQSVVYSYDSVAKTYTFDLSGLTLGSGTHVISVVPISEMLHTVLYTTYGFNSYVGFATWIV